MIAPPAAILLYSIVCPMSTHACQALPLHAFHDWGSCMVARGVAKAEPDVMATCIMRGAGSGESEFAE